jgi:hypothetical protein
MTSTKTTNQTRVEAPDGTDKALSYVQALAKTGFWGAATIRFQAGQATHMTIEESLVPSSLPENPRSFNARNNE